MAKATTDQLLSAMHFLADHYHDAPSGRDTAGLLAILTVIELEVKGRLNAGGHPRKDLVNFSQEIRDVIEGARTHDGQRGAAQEDIHRIEHFLKASDSTKPT